MRHSAAVVRFGRADGSADGSPSVIIANDRHLGGSTLKLHRRPSVGHVAVPMCLSRPALSL